MESEFIKTAIREVNKNLILVIASGICGTTIIGGIWAVYSLIGAGIAIILNIIVYGRIVESISNKQPTSAKEIIKTNGVNYIVVIFLLAIPVLLFRTISQAFLSGISIFFIEQVARMVVAVATIYVIPIVFLKKNSIISIPAGITYLFSSLKMSKELISIVIATFLLGYIIRIFFVTHLEFGLAISAIILVGIGVTYSLYVVFAGAALILIHNKAGITNAT